MDRKVILDAGRNLMKQSRAEDVRKMQAQITALQAGLRKAIEVVRELGKSAEQFRSLVQQQFKSETPQLNELIDNAATLLPKWGELVKEGKAAWATGAGR